MDHSTQGSLSITNSRNLPKLMSIESVMPYNHLILCHPFLLLLSNFPSIGVFSDESALCIKWPKYWSFSFNISPSNEQSGLISFRMDWLDLLAVHGTLKSLSNKLALSNSMKLWTMPRRATQDEWVMVESSDKKRPAGEKNGKPLQYSCLENPIKSMKRQKDGKLKDEFPISRCPICSWRYMEK